MKRLAGRTFLTLVLAFVLAGTVYAAGGDLDWSYSSATTAKQDVRGVAFDSSGCTVLVGVDDEGSASDWFVAKVAADGSILSWPKKNFDLASGIDVATAVVIDGNDDIIVTGYGHNGSNYDIHTIKYAGSDGAVLWQHTYAGAAGGDDIATAIGRDSSNNIYVGGYLQGSSGKDDFVVIKFQASGPVNGAPLWVTPINGSADGNDRLMALAVNGSSLAVTGESESATAGDFNCFTHKLNLDGTFAWTGGPRIFSDSGNGKGLDVAIDSAGNVVVTGYADNGSRALFTAKYAAADGNPIWSVLRPGETIDGGHALEIDGNDDVIVTGTSYSSSTAYDVFTVKYRGADPVGGAPVVLWEDDYNSSNGNHDVGIALALDAGGDAYVTAYSNDAAGGYDDILTLKLCGEDGTRLWPANTLYDLAGRHNRPVSIGIGAAGNVLIGGWAETAATGYDLVTLSYDPGALDPPTGLSATTLTNTSIRLTWTDNSGPPDAEDNFVIERRAESEGVFSEIATLAAGTVSYNSTGLNTDVRYYFRVKAVSGADGSSAWSNVASARTTVISYATPSWLHLHAGTARGDDDPYAIATGADQHPVVTGSSFAGVTTGGYDYLTLKLDRTDATATLWSARYNDGDNEGDTATSVVVDSQNRVVVTGYSSLYGGGGGNTNDIYTIGYPAGGPPATWDDQYNGPAGNDDKSSAVAVAKDGSDNTVVIGYGKNAAFDNDIYVIKFDPAGNRLWTATPYDGGGNDYPNAVAIDASGNVFVAGRTHNGIDDDWFVAKYNAATGVQDHLAALHDFSGNGADYAEAIVVDGNGDVYVTGYADNGSSGDIYTVKYAGSDLAILWQASHDSGYGYDHGADIGIDPVDGSLLVAGTSFMGSGNHDFRLIRYAAAGDTETGAGVEIWNHRFDMSASDDSVTAMAIDQSGVATLTGTSGDDILTIKIDHNELIVGANVFDGAAGSLDYPADVAVNRYGEAFVAGSTMNGDAVPNTDYLVFMADGGVLQAPYPLTATQLYAEVDLVWQDNDLVGSGFVLQRKLGTCAAENAWQPLATFGATTSAYVDTPVNDNTTYCYRLKATSAADSSRWVELEVSTADPLAPSDLNAALLNDSDIQLTWTDNTTDATGYEFVIERCAGDACDFTTLDPAVPVVVSAAAVTDIGTGVATYVDETACSGDVYRYRVLARKAGLWTSLYSTPTASEGIAPVTPGAPSGLVADRVTETLVDLSWTDNSDGEDDFVIERCDGDATTCASGPWSPLGTLATISGNVLLLRMDEVAWDGTPGEVNDFSAAANHGTATGGETVVDGRFGRAGAFSGGYDRVTTPLVIDQSDSSAGATFSAWVRPQSGGTADYLFDTDNGGSDWGLLHNGSNWLVATGVDGGPVDTGVAVTFGEWQHIAVTFDAATGVTLYKNGTSVFTDASIDFDASVANLSVGFHNHTGGQLLSYAMDETSWDRHSASVADSSGNDRHGTPSFNSASLESGVIGRAGTFNGTSDYVATPLNIDQSSGGTGATFEAWVRPDSSNSSYQHVISTDFDGNDWSLYLRYGTWYVKTGTGAYNTFAADIGAWQHIVAVFDPVTGVKLYKNGGASTWSTASIGFDGDDANVTIAYRSPADTSSSYYFDGQIDQVVIYDHPLTSQDVIERYRNRSVSGTVDEVAVFNRPLDADEIAALKQHGVARYEDATIVADRNYSYRVAAGKAASCASDWPTAASDPVSVNTRPRGPDTYATVEETGRVRLDWYPNTTTQGGFAVLRCDVAVDGAGCTPDDVLDSSLAADARRYVDTTGCIGHIYRYRVDLAGISPADPGTTDEATIPDLDQPAGLAVDAVSEGHVDLSWTAGDPAASGFRIGQCDTAGSCTQVSDFAPTTAITGLPSGNLLLLHMDEPAWTSGVAGVHDSSGQAKHGTPYNGLTTTIDGRYGWAGTFDGSDDYLAVPLTIDQTVTGPGATFEAWLYPTMSDGNYRHAISTENGGSDWALTLRNNYWYIFTGSSIYGAFPATLNAWQHVVVAFDPRSGVQVYLNGAQSIYTTPYIGFDTNTAAITIGRYPTSTYSGYHFPGRIDEVAVYNRPLTATEALDRYQRTVRYRHGILAPAKDYLVRVWPIKDDDCASTGPESEIAVPTTADPADLAPDPLTSSDVGTTRVDLAWTNLTTSETALVVQRCDGTQAACGTADSNFGALDVSLAAAADAYVDATVCAASAYTYRVRAERTGTPAWVTPWRYVERPAQILPAPADFVATPLSESEIGFSWGIAPLDQDRYLLERCPGTSFACGSPAMVMNAATLQDLQLYYRMDEAAWTNGSANVLDWSGNNRNGTPYNNATTKPDGKYDRAGSLPNSNDYISTSLTVDQSIDSPGATFEAWVYPNLSDSSNYRHLFSTENGGSDWSLATYNGIWYVYTGETIYSTGIATTLDSWQHVAVTFTPGVGVAFYRNGGQVPADKYTTTSIDYDANTLPLVIGAYANSPTSTTMNFNGSIDEAAVYARPLSAAEVLSHYLAQVERFEFVDTGLSPGSDYTYRLSAVKSPVDGCAWTTSAAYNSATFDVPAPEQFEVTDHGTTEIDLAWIDKTGAEDDYQLQRCNDTPANCGSVDANFTALDQVLDADSEAYSDATACPGRDYTYRVRARKNLASPIWETDWVYLAAHSDAVLDLTDFALARVSEVRIDLSWDDPNSDESGFVIERCRYLPGDAACTVFAPLDTIAAAAATVTYSDDELEPGYAYRYRVKAFKAAGSNPCNGDNGWETAYAGPLALEASIAAPNLTGAVEQGTSRVDLDWVNNAPTATGTVIERCSDHPCSDAYVVVATAPRGATTYSDTTACQGLTYSYRVKSVGAGLSGADGDCWTKRSRLTFTAFAPETVYEIEVPYDADMRTDFGDLRFFDATGQRQLDHWTYRIVDQGQPTAKARILLRTWHNDDVYLYYGNPAAIGAGGKQGFVLFEDDFTGSQIDAARWTEIDNNNYITQNDGLQLHDLIAGYQSWSSALISRETFARDAGLEIFAEVSLPDDTDGYNDMVIGWEQDQTANASYAYVAHGLRWFYYTTYGYLYAYEGSTNISPSPTRMIYANNDYDMKVVPDPIGGAHYFLRGGAYADWTEVLDTTGNGSRYTGSPLRVSILQSAYSATLRSIQVRRQVDTSMVTLDAEQTSACTSPGYAWESGYSIEDAFATPRLALAPTLDAVTAIDDTRVALAWTNNTDADAAFDIQRCCGSGCSFGTIATDVSATGYDDTSVPPSSSCAYRVYAVKDTGTCNWSAGPSNSQSAETFAATPSGLTAVAENSRLIRLEWIDNAGDEDGFEIQVRHGKEPYRPTAIVGPNFEVHFDGRNIEPERTYTYRIRSFRKAEADTYQWSGFVDSDPVTTPPWSEGDGTCKP